MIEKEKWNKNNLILVDSDEYLYMDFVDLIEEKIIQINHSFHSEINMETYYDIINERDKVKQLDKLKRVHSLLGEIEKILNIDGNEE